MRILQIGFDASIIDQRSVKPGDTKERHIAYARALRERHAEGSITMLVRAPPGAGVEPVQVADGLVVYPVPCRRSGFARKALQQTRQLLQSHHFDLVSTQTPFDDGLIGVWLRRRYALPLNVQMRSSFLDAREWIRQRPAIYGFFNRLGRWVAHHADTIRVVSYGERDRLEHRFPRLRGKVLALHPFVNRHTFGEPISQGEIRQALTRLGLDGHQRRAIALFVGRLAAEKDLPTLFRAFTLVQERLPHSLLLIAGDGPRRSQLHQLGQQFGLDSHIVWLGALPLRDLRLLYHLAQATVLPSLYEGLPKIVVESYLTGTAVVATPFVSAPELIPKGTGFIAPRFRDHVWLAEHLLLLMQDPDAAGEMGQKGKEHIEHYLLPEAEYLERLMRIWWRTRDAGLSA